MIKQKNEGTTNEVAWRGTKVEERRRREEAKKKKKKRKKKKGRTNW